MNGAFADFLSLDEQDRRDVLSAAAARLPQPELRATIERDYAAMQGMILGDAPEFGWIIEQLQTAETAINDNRRPLTC